VLCGSDGQPLKVPAQPTVHLFPSSGNEGGMAEKVVVPSSQYTIVPDGMDDIMAAAIAIPNLCIFGG